VAAIPNEKIFSPSIALIIPTMDKSEHLRKTLPRNAALEFDEIIVVDSSKKEREQVETLCRSFGVRYVFIETDRLRARNAGVSMATCDWVMICDDDIILTKFDKQLFHKLAQKCDFMFGGWGRNAECHFAWIFRRDFFLDVLKGYDPIITGGDDLDITLRATKHGRGMFVYGIGLYESEAIGLDISRDYPSKWIKNKVLYALSWYPLIRRHPFLIRNFLLSDAWRLKNILKRRQPAIRTLFESFIDRSGAIFSPIHFLILKSKRKYL